MHTAKPSSVALALLALVGGSASSAFAQSTAPAQDPAAIQRPAWKFLRQNEDWSVLAGKTDGLGFLDRIKYVSLSDDNSIWASFGGRFRYRPEYWRNFAFGPSNLPNDDFFTLTRLMVHGDFHFGEHARLFLEGKGAYSSDRDLPGFQRPIDVDEAELQQAFIDVSTPLGNGKLTGRVGRFMLEFGRQRLISPLPWANALNQWQGVDVSYADKDWKINGFGTEFIPVDPDGFNKADADIRFHGIYATHPMGTGGMDWYGLYLNKPTATFNGTTGEESRITLGTRQWRKTSSNIELEAEVAGQFGRVSTHDITAGMIALEMGRLWGEPVGGIRGKAGLDYASGDRSGGGDVQTFNQHFPLGHAYFGQQDYIGRQNIVDAWIGANHKPTKPMTLRFENHLFWLADSEDAVYNAGGGVLRPGGTSEDLFVGIEVDLGLKYDFNRNLVFDCGYSHFFPGAVIQDSAADDASDFLYVSLEYTF